MGFYTGLVYDGSKAHDVLSVRAVRSGPLPDNNFIDNNDGTITDTSTGLMWQKATAPGTYTWQQALAYCEDRDLAGHTDWRLPDKNELQSLIDYSIPIPGPTINTTYFPDTVASNYWSSTTYASSISYAWLVDFIYGGVSSHRLKAGYLYVRAVRSGQYVLLGDLGTLCIEDYHCDEGEVCVEGECVEDQPPEFLSKPLWTSSWMGLSSDPANPHKPQS